MTPIHDEMCAECCIKIYPDDSPLNPVKDFDLFGKLICFHKRYDLGHKHNYATPQDALEHFKEAGTLHWPVYLLDHSGLSMTMHSSRFSACDSAGWDWGQVGWICVEKEDALKEFSKKRITPQLLEKIEKCAESTVEIYDQYLRGDVYGYVVDFKGDKEESCWGFYGYEYCLEEARDVARAIQSAKKKEYENKLKAQIINRVPLEYRQGYAQR